MCLTLIYTDSDVDLDAAWLFLYVNAWTRNLWGLCHSYIRASTLVSEIFWSPLLNCAHRRTSNLYYICTCTGNLYRRFTCNLYGRFTCNLYGRFTCNLNRRFTCSELGFSISCTLVPIISMGASLVPEITFVSALVCALLRTCNLCWLYTNTVISIGTSVVPEISVVSALVICPALH